MKEFLAISLVALLICLPSVDPVCCPDGCADAASAQVSMDGGSLSFTGGCSLCLNGIAVNRHVEMPAPVAYSLAMRPAPSPEPILVAPKQVDRPPRS